MPATMCDRTTQSRAWPAPTRQIWRVEAVFRNWVHYRAFQPTRQHGST
jgi:hypothetical protein